jgi:hypothetical protein
MPSAHNRQFTRRPYGYASDTGERVSRRRAGEELRREAEAATTPIPGS